MLQVSILPLSLFDLKSMLQSWYTAIVPHWFEEYASKLVYCHCPSLIWRVCYKLVYGHWPSLIWRVCFKVSILPLSLFDLKSMLQVSILPLSLFDLQSMLQSWYTAIVPHWFEEYASKLVYCHWPSLIWRVCFKVSILPLSLFDLKIMLQVSILPLSLFDLKSMLQSWYTAIVPHWFEEYPSKLVYCHCLTLIWRVWSKVSILPLSLFDLKSMLQS